jgi:GT2 family glycosyltransferase
MNRIGIGILFFNELENAKKILEGIREFELQEIDFYFFDNGSNNPEFSGWLLGIGDENVKVLQVRDNLGFGGGR